MPFAANRQVGELREGGGLRGVRGGRFGQDVDFGSAATGLQGHFCASLAFITMHNVSGSWQRCVKYWYIGKGQDTS